ncbi:MAG: HAD superfamily hydrolase (TIGR01509 family) [Gammaproteobacteria bacterium]|jgi:HAD superfamily hydrolase (TIGR01509 family)
MRTLKAIIFDVDGTLAATEEIHRQAFNEAFKEFKIPFQWPVSEYIELLSISGGKERIFKYLESHDFNIPDDENLRDYTLRVHQRKSEIYRAMLIAGHIGLRNGVERLIKEAKQKGISMAIATCTSRANVEVVLKSALGEDALSYFETLVSCDLVADKKPSPEVYQFALANLGLKPENCIVIEDTSNGNLAALAAGIKTVITTHPLTVDEDFTGASLVIDQLGEPEQHFTATSGNSFGANYVDIDLLEKMISLEDSSQHQSDHETDPRQSRQEQSILEQPKLSVSAH